MSNSVLLRSPLLKVAPVDDLKSPFRIPRLDADDDHPSSTSTDKENLPFNESLRHPKRPMPPERVPLAEIDVKTLPEYRHFFYSTSKKKSVKTPRSGVEVRRGYDDDDVPYSPLADRPLSLLNAVSPTASPSAKRRSSKRGGHKRTRSVSMSQEPEDTGRRMTKRYKKRASVKERHQPHRAVKQKRQLSPTLVPSKKHTFTTTKDKTASFQRTVSVLSSMQDDDVQVDLLRTPPLRASGLTDSYTPGFGMFLQRLKSVNLDDDEVHEKEDLMALASPEAVRNPFEDDHMDTPTMAHFEIYVDEDLDLYGQQSEEEFGSTMKRPRFIE
jgi:hypothetical protein